ncbi:MAG: hypothetical protein RMK17_02615 [bacterium]|nr:hypothetical protein [bacterium]
MLKLISILLILFLIYYFISPTSNVLAYNTYYFNDFYFDQPYRWSLIDQAGYSWNNLINGWNYNYSNNLNNNFNNNFNYWTFDYKSDYNSSQSNFNQQNINQFYYFDDDLNYLNFRNQNNQIQNYFQFNDLNNNLNDNFKYNNNYYSFDNSWNWSYNNQFNNQNILNNYNNQWYFPDDLVIYPKYDLNNYSNNMNNFETERINQANQLNYYFNGQINRHTFYESISNFLGDENQSDFKKQLNYFDNFLDNNEHNFVLNNQTLSTTPSFLYNSIFLSNNIFSLNRQLEFRSNYLPSYDLITEIPVMNTTTRMSFWKGKLYVVGYGTDLYIIDVNSRNVEIVNFSPFNPAAPNRVAIDLCISERWGIIIPVDSYGAFQSNNYVTYQIINGQIREIFRQSPVDKTGPVTRCYIDENERLYLISGAMSEPGTRPLVIFNPDGTKNFFELDSFLKIVSIISSNNKIYLALFDIQKNKMAIGTMDLENLKINKLIYFPEGFQPTVYWSNVFGFPDKYREFKWAETKIAYPVFKFNRFWGEPPNNNPNGFIILDTIKDEIVDFLQFYIDGGILDYPFTLAAFSINNSDVVYLKPIHTTDSIAVFFKKRNVIQFMSGLGQDEDDKIYFRGIEVVSSLGDQDIIAILKKNRVVFINYKHSNFNLPVLVNAANYFVRDYISPGQISTIFGNFSEIEESLSANKFPLPTNLGGVELTIEHALYPSNKNVKLPLFYVSPTQINFQAPWDLPIGVRGWEIIIRKNGNIIGKIPSIFISQSDIGFFSLYVDGYRKPIIVGQDGRLISSFNPARRGEWITLYLTGLGKVNPPTELGKPAAYDFLSLVDPPPKILWNNQPAEFNFAGLAPGWVGLYQINIKVPENISNGLHIIKISSHNDFSRENVLINVGI